MRVLLLSLLLVAGTQANFFTDIGNAFKTTFDQLVDQGKQVGNQLLDELKVTGAQLASQGLQALMLNVADALSSTDAPATSAPAKRQLDTGLAGVDEDPNGVIFQHADELKQYMQTALNATNRLEHPEKYQQTIQEFMNLIDRVVAKHQSPETSSFKKRQLDQALAPLKVLSGLVMSHSNQLKTYMQTSMAALSGLAQKVDQPQTYQDLAGFLAMVDKVVADHNASVDAVLKNLLQEVTSLAQEGSKRSLANSMNAIAQGLAKVFQPNAEVVKSMVSSMGDLLKKVSTTVLSSLVRSEAHLGAEEVLGGEHPADVLKQQSAAVAQAGQAALGSLKGAVSTMLKQAVVDLKPHLNAIFGEVLSALSRQ